MKNKVRNNHNIRFCLKAIIIWEALTGRAYSRIELQEEEQVKALLYAMYLAADNKPISQEIFEMSLQSQHIAHNLVDEAVQAITLNQRLSENISTIAIPSSKKSNQEEEQEPQPLSPLIARLIIEGGIDAHYVLYQMSLWELPLYLNALAEQRQENIERERLWCYLNLSPHIDHKKVKSPQDLLPLPHEQRQKDQEDVEQDEIYRLMASSGFSFVSDEPLPTLPTIPTQD